MLQQTMNSQNVMTLDKMGSRYPSRLSFSRSMLRRLLHDNWKITKSKFDLNDQGYGTVVYEIAINQNIYSLVCFSQHLANEDRSDRVIAEKWDTAYSLINGKLDEKELTRLKENVPLQESGRNSSKELILSRANKSVRLFKYVVNCLSKGEQPDLNEINKVGYILRTTAVYGSGKFGLSDFSNTKEVTDFKQPFRAEMLAVYLIREFSVELVEHVAKKKNPEKAVKLNNNIKQHLGIGNSTGLGMAPFIIKHPKLINKWMSQYTQSLKNILNQKIDEEKINGVINKKDIKQKVGFKNSNYNIVQVGSVQEVKGQDILIKQFDNIKKLCPKAKLYFVGNYTSEWGKSLVNHSKFSSLAKDIIFLGHKSNALDYLCVADLIIHPSRGEALPRVVIEGMALGGAIIVSEIDGHKELIQHGDTGYLFDLNNPMELTHLVEVLYNDKNKAKRMGASAKNYCFENYSEKNMKNAYKKLFDHTVL